MPGPIRGILAPAIRDLRGSWRALALTDLACKLVAFAALTPGAVLLLRWAMSRAGTAVIADTEIATFFLTTPQGITALVAGGAIVAAITALELACLMAIGAAAASGRVLTVKGALAFGAARAWPILRLTANLVVRLLVGLVPFAVAIAAVYFTLLRYHDINFYLATRPPAFWVAVALAAVIVAVLGVVAVRTIARWALALPLVLFESVVPRRALAESAARTAPIRPLTMGSVALWAAIAAGLVALAAWVPEVIGRGLAPRFAGSLEALLAFVVGIVLVWAGLGLAAGVVNASLFSIVLVRLYRRAGAGPAYQAPGLDATAGIAAFRLPRGVRLAGVGVVILAASGFTLAVTSIARRDQPVAVIAHRGASYAAPENTLAAFRLAADERADFVELDVQESADAEVIVAHDSDLMKVGRSPAKIWEATAAELRAVDIGSFKDARFAAERVPTLAEALGVCKGRVRVIVELKSYDSQRLEERVVEIVEAAGMERETVFMSLDHAMVKRMKELRPSWTVGALVAKAIGDLTSLGADFLAVEAGLATRAFVRQAHAARQAVYVWTVNDPALMLSAMSRGVDGLITDRPDAAREVVQRRSAMSDAQRILVALLVRLGVRPTP